MPDKPSNERFAPSPQATPAMPAARLAGGEPRAGVASDSRVPPDDTAPPAPSYYLLTHTAAESARQQQQHRIFYEALGNHHLAAMPACPLPDQAWLLDVGCGDGYWLRDVLREWPRAIGVGVDLTAPRAPALPEAFRSPTRALFVASNLVTGLPFADGTFYLVHQRMLGAALPRGIWPAALAELVRVTAPGGWIECLEGGPVEDIPASCPAVRRLQDWTDALAAQRDIALSMNARIGDLLGATDGVDPVSLYVYTIPLRLKLPPTPTPALGRSGDHLAPLSARAARNWLEARRTLASQIIARGWADDAAHAELLGQAEQELSAHAVPWPIHVAYARRLR